MTNSKQPWFDHERLDVYQEAITFVTWAAESVKGKTQLGEVRTQLDRASTSIVLNIAEGNGKFSAKDRCRFFDIAHGSALECSACLDILAAKNKLSAEQVGKGKECLQRIVRMLIGLIKRNSRRPYERQGASEG
jgi:four helix bundle protein